MKIRYLVTLGILFVSTTSWAGSWSSGGGNAVVCQNPQGQIISAELLDLYEGRVVHGLSYQTSTSPYLKQAVEAAKAISNKDISFSLVDLVPKMADQFQFLPSDTGLQPLEDSFQIVVPKGCQITQTARYESNNVVYIDSDIWAVMNEQNKAALLLHETLYWSLRVYGEKTSVRTRAAVAHAFAGTKFLDVNDELPNNVEICQTDLGKNGLPWAAFYSYPASDKTGVVIQFMTFGGNVALAKTTAKLFDAQWPLSENRKDTLWFVYTDSIIDNKIPFFLRLQPDMEKTGFIDLQNDTQPPKRSFHCKVTTRS